jgi:hypothetical protein
MDGPIACYMLSRDNLAIQAVTTWFDEEWRDKELRTKRRGDNRSIPVPTE